MSQPLSRRVFLALTGGALAVPSVSWATDAEDDDEVPALLDHLIVGCRDLDRGIDFVEEKTGVRPAMGGVHPGRGTRNALLSLGERRYLEIMGADPEELSLAFKRMGLDLPVERSDKARLRALISGPKGDLGLST